ncbi:hypothetical protein Tco_1168731 [Tanacetum coccineum]
MSDNIPFEIQVEIMNRLPVKSLLLFRSFGAPPDTLDPTIVKISYPISGQGFNNQDKPIVEAATCHCKGHSVQVYNPESDLFNNVTQILGNVGSFYVGPYKESMILATYPKRMILA